MASLSDSEAQLPGLLVRVKRARTAAPVPELLLEAPQPQGKRRRVAVRAPPTSMKLLDSINLEQWHFEAGLPRGWSQAACSRAPAPTPPKMGLGEEPPKDPTSTKRQGLEEATPTPAFREAGRQVITGHQGQSLQLLDIESRQRKRQTGAPPSVLSGFLIDGQPLVATSTGEASPGQDDEDDEDEDGDFVYDIYAPASSSSQDMMVSSALDQLSSSALQLDGGFVGSVELLRPLDEEGWEDEVIGHDFDDIDDSSSDDSAREFTGAWRGRRSDGGSSSDGNQDAWDADSDEPETRWVDAMD
mmetsp:Transcript_38733/g.58419  ORF Transcript_38733/g.58419 Transcript_38733/m.58419 type:complete len:301 (+) Transcript_38733:137-1039(+)